MTDTLDAISRTLSNEVRTLGTISQNVANAHTPGYRALRTGPDFADVAGLRTVPDQRDGGLAQTGRPLDLALRGAGFLVVEREGQALLVRSGALRMDADGRLLTAQGDAVLGASGPIVIPGGANATLRVEADGRLWADEQEVDQLRLVAASDPGAITPLGTGTYDYRGELLPWQGSVVQGALERANVDAADEMLRLIETTRHIDSVRRAISTYDQMLDRGINNLGNN